MEGARGRHFVFLIHVWALVPFLLVWLSDRHIQAVLGADAVAQLQPTIAATIAYLVVRTLLAWKGPSELRWEWVFPPVDVIVISLILYCSHRGPMSNLSVLFFLPVIEASSCLSVGWSAAVGGMTIVGLALASIPALGVVPEVPSTTSALLKTETLNVVFRVYFMLLVASLMTFQSLMVSRLRERVGIAADRARIAMDMHDGVQAHLIALASQLELIERIAPKDGERASVLADQSRESATSATDELRFLVQRLRAPALMDGFVSALRQYAFTVCERHSLKLEFKVEGHDRSLHGDVENALFRIAQEALNNVVKHARAQKVVVELKLDSSVELTLSDDGAGFDPSLELREDAFGLLGMGERAKKLGGSVRVSSTPGSGTCVTVNLALKPAHQGGSYV